MAQVYFATNRVRDAGKPGGFGDTPIADPSKCEYGVIDVTGTKLADSDSGVMGPITAGGIGGFDDATKAAIADSGKNLLIFVHGFANSFQDAIKRAAFNREWLAASTKKGADTTVLAFTWPTAGNVLSKDLFNPAGQYVKDRRQADASGAALALFLRQALEIARQAKTKRPSTRVFLLAHSMGHVALNAAMKPFFQDGAPPVLFDEAILAASDIDDQALEKPRKFGLYRIRELAVRTSVYHSNFDLPLKFSQAVNGYWPLGLGGADSETDTSIYPVDTFRSVSCSLVFDLHDVDGDIAIDESHQYYRRSPTVRKDIAALMNGDKVKPGLSWLISPLRIF